MERKTLANELHAAFVAILIARGLSEELADQFMALMSRSLKSGEAIEGHAQAKRRIGGPKFRTSVENALDAGARKVLGKPLTDQEMSFLEAVTDNIELLTQHAESNQLRVGGAWGNSREVQI